MGTFRNAYHPERHYMRGPGPKWHAKHTASLVAAAGVQPVLSEGAGPAAARNSTETLLATWIAPTAAAAVLGFVAVMILA